MKEKLAAKASVDSITSVSARPRWAKMSLSHRSNSLREVAVRWTSSLPHCAHDVNIPLIKSLRMKPLKKRIFKLQSN